MLRRTYEGQDCSIAHALEVVGERWTLLIIRDALVGLRRFDEFQRNLGIARKVLAERSDHFRLEEVEFVPGPGRGSR
jgi:DNA-binding HxlR family transcriptional regulator